MPIAVRYPLRKTACLGCVALLSGLPVGEASTPSLQNLDLEDLLQVRVVGAAKYEQAQQDAAAAVSVITREEIRRFGWRTLGEALRTLPGVFSTYDRQYDQVGTRGLGFPGDYNTRLLLTINGNRVNDPQYDMAPTGRDFPLDMDLVERIEFIPGPGGAMYGQNAMLGVVNVVTRSGHHIDGLEASAGYRLPEQAREARLSWGGRLDSGVEVLVSLSGLRSLGDDLPMEFGAGGPAGTVRGLDGERNTQAHVQAIGSHWQAEWSHGSRRKEDPTGAFQSDPFVPGQYQRDLYSTGQFRYQTTIGNGWDLSARAFAGAYRYDSTFKYDSVLKNTSEANWWGTEWQISTTVFDAHHALIGFELQQNATVRQKLNYAGNPAGDFDINTPGHRIGLFFQDEWRISPVLSATWGLRADHGVDGSTTTNPRAALIWQASNRTTLKGLVGEAHRLPNAFEAFYDDGVSITDNPQLGHEHMQTLEFVASHRLSDRFVLQASAYRWRMTDVIALGQDPASGLSQYQAGPRIQTDGLEVSADHSWPGGIRLRGNLSFANQSIVGTAMPVNSPRWMARALASAPLHAAGLQLAYEMRLDDRRRTYAGSFTGSNVVADLRLFTTQWIPGVELAMKVRNLFDRRYDQPAADTNWQSALEQDGRSITLQVQAKY